MIPPPKKLGGAPTKKRRSVSIFLDDEDDDPVAPVVESASASEDPPSEDVNSIVASELERLLGDDFPDVPPPAPVVTPAPVVEVRSPAPVLAAKDTRASSDMYSLLDEASEPAPDDKDSIPDIVAIVDRAISSDLDPSIFTERSFPVAANVIEWCRSPEYLGFSKDLYPRQIQTLAHFFGDICFFCSDTEYVYNVPVKDSIGNVLDRFTLLQYGVCPKCKRNRTEIYQEWQKDPRFSEYNTLSPEVSPLPYPPNEFVGVWGQRSGKSYTISTFSCTYVLHRFLSLPNPARYFFQPNNAMFEASFVAPTVRQVEDNAWQPFRQALYGSPWFKEVRDSYLEDGKRLGVRTFHSGSTFLMFENKRLVIHMKAAHGANLRGATRLWSVIDELGHFNVTEEGKRRVGVRDGEAVLDAMTSSLMTLRGMADIRRTSLNDYNTLDGYIFLISSPSSIADPIMTKAATAPFSPRMYYSHYATYEINPNLTKEFIRTQLAKNEAQFLRDFCAIPPRASAPFFSDSKLLSGVSTEDTSGPIFKCSVNREKLESDVLTRLLPTPYDIKPDLYSARVMAVDNGEVNNSFALCVARYDPEIDGMRIEEFVEVAPYRGHVVDLAWCYDKLILPLAKAYKFLHVCFDRWNSSYAVYDLRTKLGLDAQIYTLKSRDFEAYRDDLRGMKIRLPAPEVDPESLLSIRDPSLRSGYPRAHFQLQLTTVNQFGNKLLKPDNDSDDLFRVSVLAHRFLSKFKEEYKKYSVGMGRRRAEFRSVGVFRGASQRGGGGPPTESRGSAAPSSGAPSLAQPRERAAGHAGLTRQSLGKGRRVNTMRG